MMGGRWSWHWGIVGDVVCRSHGQSSGLGGRCLRPLDGRLAVLPPHQLVGLKQALVAPAATATAAAVRKRQHSCTRQTPQCVSSNIQLNWTSHTGGFVKRRIVISTRQRSVPQRVFVFRWLTNPLKVRRTSWMKNNNIGRLISARY